MTPTRQRYTKESTIVQWGRGTPNRSKGNNGSFRLSSFSDPSWWRLSAVSLSMLACVWANPQTFHWAVFNYLNTNWCDKTSEIILFVIYQWKFKYWYWMSRLMSESQSNSVSYVPTMWRNSEMKPSRSTNIYFKSIAYSVNLWVWLWYHAMSELSWTNGDLSARN